MGRNTRWYKFQRRMDKFKNWFRKLRYGKIGPNKGIDNQRGTVDGFINEERSGRGK
ncbi:MAG: hypothetical protein ACTSRD_03090 [Promethearchaeota archaeon]